MGDVWTSMRAAASRGPAWRWVVGVVVMVLYAVSIDQLLVGLANQLGDVRKTSFWFFFSTDTLPFSRIYDDVLVDGASWWGWWILGGRASYVEMLWHFLQHAVVGDGPDAMVLNAITYPILVALACLLVLSTIRPLTARDGLLALLALTLFQMAIASWVADPLFAFIWTGRHSDTGLGAILIPGLTLRFLVNPLGARAAGLLAATTLFSMSSPMFMGVCAPALLIVLLLHFRRGSPEVRRLAAAGGLVLFGTALGRGLNALLTPTATVAHQGKLVSGERILANLTLERVTANARKLGAVFDHWSTSGFYIWAFVLAALATAAYIGWFIAKKRRLEVAEGAWRLRFFAALAVVMSCVNVASTLASGNIHRRYLLVACTMPLLSLLLLAREQVAVLPARGREATVAAAAVVTLLIMVAGWTTPLPNRQSPFDYYPNVARCIDEHADEHDLRYGVAGYWMSGQITAFSKRGVRAYQVKPDGQPYSLANNRNWYRGDQGARAHRSPEYTFVVEGGKDRSTRLTHKAIERHFGPATGHFDCERGIRVWLYPPPANARLQERVTSMSGVYSR